MARPLVRAVFALLVVATIAAFFVTQQLKSEYALVLRFAAKPKQFSPERRRHARPHARSASTSPAPRPSPSTCWTARATRSAGSWTTARWPATRSTASRWDGRDDDGVPVPDGLYRMRVVQRSEGRVINSSKRIRVDREPPRGDAARGGARRDRAARAGPADRGGGPLPRAEQLGARVPRVPHRRGRRAARGAPLPRQRRPARRSGTGEVAAGPEQTEPAPDGDYAFTVTVRDKAGNPTVAPAEIPTADTARAGHGRVGAELHAERPARASCRPAPRRRSRWGRSTAASTS